MKAVVKDFELRSRESWAENRNGVVLHVESEDGRDLGQFFMSLDGEYLEPKLGVKGPSNDILKGFESHEDLKKSVRQAIPEVLGQSGNPIIFPEALKFAVLKGTPEEVRSVIPKCADPKDEHALERACTQALFTASNFHRDSAVDELLPHSYPSHFTERQRELLYEPRNLERTEYINHAFEKQYGPGKGVPAPIAQDQAGERIPTLVATQVQPETVGGKFGLMLDVRAQDPYRNFEFGPQTKLWMSLDLKELRKEDGSALNEHDIKALGYQKSADFIERAKDLMDAQKGEALNRAAVLGKADTVRYLQEHHVSPEESTQALMSAASSPLDTNGAMKELAKHANLALFEEQFEKEVKNLPMRKSFELDRALKQGKEHKEVVARQEQEAHDKAQVQHQGENRADAKHDASLKVSYEDMSPDELQATFLTAVEEGRHSIIGDMKKVVAEKCDQSVADEALYMAARRQDWESTKHLLAIAKTDVCKHHGWQDVDPSLQKFITKFDDRSTFNDGITSTSNGRGNQGHEHVRSPGLRR